jgi:hypothetical protein
MHALPRGRLRLVFFLSAFASQLALALPRRGNISPEAQVCVRDVEMFLRWQSPHPAATLLRGEFVAMNSAKDSWVEQYLAPEIEHALDQRLDWTRYNEEFRGQGNQHIFWLQQQRLKELNESLWNIGGTERYLMILDDELAATLDKNPAYGRIIHRNYKDRVIVSKLSEKEFHDKVLAPVEERVSKRIATLYSDSRTASYWQKWIRQTLDLGSANSVVGAHLDLKLHDVNFNSWSAQTRALRESLEQAFNAHQLGWNEAFKASREFKNDEVGLARWFKSQGDHSDDLVALAGQFRKYMNALQVADMLSIAPAASEKEAKQILELRNTIHTSPSLINSKMDEIKKLLPEAWIFERGLFLSQTHDAGFVVATDIRGLGLKSLKARDAWLVRGAHPEELPQVYQSTTRELEARYAQILKDLKALLGSNAKVDYFRSGDDALWSLPPMSENDLKRVQAYFAAQNDLYSHVEAIDKVGDGDAISDAIVRARDALFGGKGHAPEKARDGLPTGYMRVPTAQDAGHGPHRDPSSSDEIIEILNPNEGEPLSNVVEPSAKGKSQIEPRPSRKRSWPGRARIAPVFGF